jgi:hypothetical protein
MGSQCGSMLGSGHPTVLGTSVQESEEEVSMPAKRTTHRSSKGTKLYAVRGKKGEFKDIQTYKRAHGQDVKRKSKKEK